MEWFIRSIVGVMLILPESEADRRIKRSDYATSTVNIKTATG